MDAIDRTEFEKRHANGAIALAAPTLVTFLTTQTMRSPLVGLIMTALIAVLFLLRGHLAREAAGRAWEGAWRHYRFGDPRLRRFAAHDLIACSVLLLFLLATIVALVNTASPEHFDWREVALFVGVNTSGIALRWQLYDSWLLRSLPEPSEP